MSKKGGPKTVSSLTNQQRDVNAQLFPYLSKMATQPASQYGGQLSPSLVPQFDQVGKYLSQYNPFSQPTWLQGTGQETLHALRTALSGRPTYQVGLDANKTSEYMKQALLNPLMQNYQQNIAPGIRETAGGIGALSSASGRLTADALNNVSSQYAQGLGQAQLSNQQLSAQLNSQAFQQAGQRQMEAIGMSAGLRNNPQTALQGILGYEQALNPWQSTANQSTAAQYQDFLRTSPENSPWLQLAMRYLAPGQGQVVNEPGLFNQILGGIGGVAGAIGGIGSIGQGLFGTSGQTYGGSTGGTPWSYTGPSTSGLMSPFAGLFRGQ